MQRMHNVPSILLCALFELPSLQQRAALKGKYYQPFIHGGSEELSHLLRKRVKPGMGPKTVKPKSLNSVPLHRNAHIPDPPHQN